MTQKKFHLLIYYDKLSIDSLSHDAFIKLTCMTYLNLIDKNNFIKLFIVNKDIAVNSTHISKADASILSRVACRMQINIINDSVNIALVFHIKYM